VGSALPKVLHRGGSKKRQKFLIKKVCLLASLLALSVFLYFRLPSTKPHLWFIPSGLVFFVILYFAIILEDERFHFELLLFPLIFLSAVSQYFGERWINYFVFPYLTILAFNVRTRIVIFISLLLPCINFYDLLLNRNDVMIPLFYGTLSVTSIMIAVFVGQLKREKRFAEESFSALTSEAREATDGSGTLKDETISHYLATQLEVDEELKGAMEALRSSLYADSAMFFEKDSSGQLKLRFTTDNDHSIIMTGSGALSGVLNNGNRIIVEDIKSNKTDRGYIKKDDYDSMAAVCVKDGSFALGVLAVDSDRFRAFKQADLLTLSSFGDIVKHIIRRGGIYQKIKVDLEGLKILQEESLQILSTLNINELCGNIVSGINRISGEPAVIFIKKDKGHEFELAGTKGIVVPEKKEYELHDTILNLCIENRQKLILSDTSSLKKRLLPFQIAAISSFLCFPLMNEDDVLGVTATFSHRKDAFDIYQTEGIEILNNMASLSIDNVNLLHRIDEMALTDGLTGLFNHRYFQERLEEEIKRTGRTNEPLSLVLTDIDHFKSVNDDFGHPAGDAVLREVSGIIKSRMRETDMAARYGGEEFALILTNTDHRGALKIAEDLRASVENMNFSSVDRQITISLGISSYPADSSAKQDMIDKADQALYYAKENGRNNAILWSKTGK
jgi:diguanylate cyclase (GGDEF)-like protein